MRKFDRSLHISDEELNIIKTKIRELKPLIPEIEVSYRIVPVEETNCKFNGEYCLLIYSQEKENYLINAGYLLEQMDLFLASMNIGVCWYGLGKPEDKTFENKKFVIMLHFGKSKDDDFRKDIEHIDRKPIEKIWEGDIALDVAKVVRYAPSACNSQPWIVKGCQNILDMYQDKSINSPLSLVLMKYFNLIDLGIFMLILEVTLEHQGYKYVRDLILKADKNSPNHIASYTIDR